MLEQPKIIIISKFYQTHAKISKPTGATAPVEKVKEISSNIYHIITYVQNQGHARWFDFTRFPYFE